MRNKNMLFQVIYRGIWAVIAIISTVFTFTDHITALGGDGRPVCLFFTTWSIWLATVVAVPVFVTTLIRYIKGEKEGYNKCLPLLKFCNDIMILATFIISGFVLKEFFNSPGSVFKHFILPIITIFDAILFDQKKGYRVTYPLFAVVIPLIYWIIVITRALIKRGSTGIPAELWSQYYPYGFTNFDNGKTVMGLCLMLLGILCGLILIGYIFYFLDKLTKKDDKVTLEFVVNEEVACDFIKLIKDKKSSSLE